MMRKQSVIDRLRKDETAPLHADVPKHLLLRAKLELKKRDSTLVDLATIMLMDFLAECDKEKT